LFILLGLGCGGHASAAEAAKAAAQPAAELIQGIPVADFYLLTGILILELIVIFALSIYTHFMLRIIRNVPEYQAEAKALEKKVSFWDRFNKSTAVEKEKDILLDHDYDGIQELDNSLPPWWKYGFYLTIVVGVIYIYRFHVSHTGPSQEEEFVAEMQKGEEEKAAYLASAANNIDENSVVVLAEASEIAAGKEMFVKNCAACHIADGGGSVGPNLTDEYWLHGGGIKNVFKSIKYGWQDKGMKSWKDDFSPKQLQQIASFVVSLKGTHPAAPKAPQGEKYEDGGPSNAKPDSAKADNAKTVAKAEIR
jgi:cytochrome c oxidase cbb3-type subunit 3